MLLIALVISLGLTKALSLICILHFPRHSSWILHLIWMNTTSWLLRITCRWFRLSARRSFAWLPFLMSPTCTLPLLLIRVKSHFLCDHFKHRLLLMLLDMRHLQPCVITFLIHEGHMGVDMLHIVVHRMHV